MDGLGKLLISVGAGLLVLGFLMLLASRLGWLREGRLPGDISIHREGFSFYFSLVTCLLLSLVGSFVLWLIGALRR